MRRTILILVAVCSVALVAAPVASAASPHFKRGGTPTCTITGGGTPSTSTVCTGTLAGLGGEDLVIDTTVGGSAVYQCQNKGGSTAPGQNTVLTGPTTTPTTIDSDAIKNGNLTFTTEDAVLAAANTVSGAEAGCPNPNWSGVNPQLTLTDITLEISQGGVLLFTCTASNPNGLSGKVALSC